MCTIPAIALDGVAIKLAVAGRAPHIGCNPTVVQKCLRCDRFTQQRATAEQMDLGGSSPGRFANFIESPHDALFDPLGQCGMRVVLVVRSDVIKDILLL